LLKWQPCFLIHLYTLYCSAQFPSHHTTKLMTNSSSNEMCQRLKSRKVLMGYLHLRVVARLRPIRPTPAYNPTTELPIFTAFWSLRKSTSKTYKMSPTPRNRPWLPVQYNLLTVMLFKDCFIEIFSILYVCMTSWMIQELDDLTGGWKGNATGEWE